MADFCTFVPDDPSCQPVEPEPVPEVDPQPAPVEPVEPVEPAEPVQPTDEPAEEPVEAKPEEKDDGEMAEGDMKMSQEAMWGQATYLMVAISHTAHSALQLFRYRSADTYYVAGDTAFGTDATNWWSLYNMIGNYGMLSIGAILTITQLLSMFGIAASTNVMLWSYSMMLVGPILGGVVEGLAAWAYEKAYSECEAGNSSGVSCAMQEVIEWEMLQMTVAELAKGAALWEGYEGWMQGQFMALPVEQQKEWMEAHIMEEKKEQEMMKWWAKELGLDMGKDGKKGDKKDGEYEEKDGEWEEKDGDMMMEDVSEMFTF